MNVKSLFVIALLLSGVVCHAQDSSDSLSRHELRFGIGDMMFESVRWHNQAHRDYSYLPDGILKPEDVRFGYTPHFSVEYAYRALDWLSIGLVCDFQHTSWTRNFYDNGNDLVKSEKNNFFNLSFLLDIRFNYCRKEHFGVYSSIAPGIDINGGSEVDCFGNHTVAGPAIDLRLVGITAGAGQCWGFAEFGMMAALQNPEHIFLFGSQIFKVGFTYKFKQKR